MKLKFNLLDEPWVKLSDGSEVGLIQVFQSTSGRISLGGNPLEILSIFKLLLAISQSALRDLYLTDVQGWSADDYSAVVIEYLENHREQFNLYDDVSPFLQMPSVEGAAKATYNALSPLKNEPVTNSTVTSHQQIQKLSDVTDAMLARMLVMQMNFAFAGKKVDAKFFMEGNPVIKSAPVGPSLLFSGALHSFLKVDNLVETLFINTFFKESFESDNANGAPNLTATSPNGLGVAPWEKMPTNATCKTAEMLKESYMGRLVGLSRFCLINRNEKSFHYVNGIEHLSYLDGKADATLTVSFKQPDDASDSKKKQEKTRILWVNTKIDPWVSFCSIFSFMSKDKSWESLQVANGLRNCANIILVRKATLVSTGISVGLSTGETTVGGKNDFVYSEVIIPVKSGGATWFESIRLIWKHLEHCKSILYRCVNSYMDAIGQRNKGKCEAVFSQVEKVFLDEMEPLIRKAIISITSDTEENLKAMNVSATDIEQYQQGLTREDHKYIVEKYLNTKKFSTPDFYISECEKACVRAYETLQPSTARKLKNFALCKPTFFKNKVNEHKGTREKIA